jgi:FkbM family methyltransferase
MYIKDIVEKMLGVRIVRPQGVVVLLEQVHLHRFLKEFAVDCVFDVGANEGQYAEMLRTHAGYKGHIVSFEPIPALAALLRKKAAHDPLWHIEEVALGANAGKATFNVMQKSAFSSLHAPTQSEVGLFTNANKVTEQISVTIATLPEMFAKYQKELGFKRPFLKMDTQGHDLEIARGAGETLKQFVGLQSELSIKRIYEDTSDYRVVLDYFASQGFELSAFVPNNQGNFPQLIEIDCIMYNKKFYD